MSSPDAPSSPEWDDRDLILSHIDACRTLIAKRVLGDPSLSMDDNLSALVDRKLRGAGDGARIGDLTEVLDTAARMTLELPDGALEGL